MHEPSMNGGDPSDCRVGLGPRLALPTDPVQVRFGTPILAVRFDDAAHFLGAVDVCGPRVELAIETRAAHPHGSEVVLEIRWPALPNRVYVRAYAERSTSTGQRVFRFHVMERAKLDFLLAAAHGLTGEAQQRSHRRYCVRLPVRWRPFGARDMHSGVAEDLSASGVRIVAPYVPIAVGERVVVRVQAEAVGQDLVLTGVVRNFHFRTWDEIAVGVVFEHRSSGEQRNLRCLLHAFAAKGVVLFEDN